MIPVTKASDQTRQRGHTLCVCVCVLIKLHITAQSGPVILVILCVCVCSSHHLRSTDRASNIPSSAIYVVAKPVLRSLLDRQRSEENLQNSNESMETKNKNKT